MLPRRRDGFWVRVGLQGGPKVPGVDRNLVTVTESIWVNRLPEAVFDYTSDLAQRPEWDSAITKVAILSASPRAARVTVPGMGQTSVVMRLDRRPERTSAVFEDIESRWITGGGGAWSYESERGGTRWNETNTLVLRST